MLPKSLEVNFRHGCIQVLTQPSHHHENAASLLLVPVLSCVDFIFRQALLAW